MQLFRLRTRSARAGRARVGGLVVVLAVLGVGAMLAVPALGRQRAGAHSTQSAYRTAAAAVAASKVSGNSGLANLPLKMNNVMIWCNARGVDCRKRVMPTS